MPDKVITIVIFALQLRTAGRSDWEKNELSHVPEENVDYYLIGFINLVQISRAENFLKP